MKEKSVSSRSVQTYFIDYQSRKLPNPFGPMDQNDIPLYELKRFASPGKLIYHPTVIIQHALARYDRWLGKGAEEDLSCFLACATWLCENGAAFPDKRFYNHLIHFPIRTPPTKAPCNSGLTQGQALSVLLRAYQETKAERFAQTLERCIQSFLYPVEEGGVLTIVAGLPRFIEEVVTTPKIHILNGCLSALFGLYEYLQIFPNNELQEIFNHCVRGVVQALPYFDTGWWSNYSLGIRGNLADLHYTKSHINQLTYLGNLLGEDSLLHYANQWHGYQKANQQIWHLRYWLNVNLIRSFTILRLSRLKYREMSHIWAI